MATNTSDFFTFSKTAGTAKNLQKPTDGGDNNLWGGYINVDLDTIVGAVNATSDLIADANQNELVDFTATGSAVNHVGITNAATGNGPTIEAAGDDTNIDLLLKSKGTGDVKITGELKTSAGVLFDAFASGTKMLFHQSSAPTGWTKVTTTGTGSDSVNDVALRVVTGSITDGTGGSVAFETAFASQTIPTHTLSSSEIPNFSTRFNILYGGNNVNDPFTQLGSGTSITGSANSGVGVISATFYRYNNAGVSGANVIMYPETGGGGGSHGHGSVDLDVSYVDVIIATKD